MNAQKKREHLTSSSALQYLRKVITKMDFEGLVCKRSFCSGIE